MDDFKPINDRLGRATGDETQFKAASVARKSLGPGDCLCRMGGDVDAAIAVVDANLYKAKAAYHGRSAKAKDPRFRARQRY